MGRHQFAVVSSVLLLIASTASTAMAAPLAEGDSCGLTKAVRISARAKGKGKKRRTKKGVEAQVIARQGPWLQIQAGAVKGWVKKKILERNCAKIESAVVDETTDAPPAEEAFSDTTGSEAATESTPASGSATDDFGDTAAGTDTDDGDPSTESTADEWGSDDSSDEWSTSSSASTGTTTWVGLGVAYGTEVEQVGFRGEVFFALNSVVENLRGGASFVYFLPSDGVDVLTFNLDLNYPYQFGDFGVFALAGINITRASTDFGSSGEAGFNLGGGVEWYGLGMPLFLEGKYVLSDADQVVAALGVRFGL